jgi:hypothetical protein
MLPDGLQFLDSWIVDDERLDRCYQLMETDDPTLFEVWTDAWSDLVDFDVLPVLDSAQAAARVGVGWMPTTDRSDDTATS